MWEGIRRSRTPPTRPAPSAVLQDGGVKYATGASSKIRGRDNFTIGTWNTRTLRVAGKLQELTHEMDRYRWNILGLCEMRWKNFSTLLRFNIGREDFVSLAKKKSTIEILKPLRTYGCDTCSVFFKLFDVQIVPSLLYAAEL